MTDYVLPPDLVANEVEWRILDNTAVYSSPLSGAVRTYSRPGNRWGARLVFRALSDQTRRRLLSLLAALRGRANRLWFTEPGYTFAGSFSCPELLTNNAAVANTTGWSSSDSELVLTADSHLGLRFFRSGVVADRFVSQSAVTTVTSADYAFRAVVEKGKGNVRLALNAGTTAGDTSLLAGTTRTAAGRYTEAFTASGASTHISIADLISGRAANAFQFVSWASVARCARVNGASQTGSTLDIDGLPASAVGVIRAGDWFEINGELKRAIADVNSNASGQGFLMFEPQLRTSPADNTPVILQAPMGRFLLSSDESMWQTRPGTLSELTLDLVEDIS
jgi:hypothetical protein